MYFIPLKSPVITDIHGHNCGSVESCPTWPHLVQVLNARIGVMILRVVVVFVSGFVCWSDLHRFLTWCFEGWDGSWAAAKSAHWNIMLKWTEIEGVTNVQTNAGNCLCCFISCCPLWIWNPPMFFRILRVGSWCIIWWNLIGYFYWAPNDGLEALLSDNHAWTIHKDCMNPFSVYEWFIHNDHLLVIIGGQ